METEIYRRTEPLEFIPDQFQKQNRIQNEDLNEMKARMKQVKAIMSKKHWRRDYKAHLKFLTKKKKNRTQKVETTLAMTMWTTKTNSRLSTFVRDCTAHCSKKERTPASLDWKASKNTSAKEVWWVVTAAAKKWPDQGPIIAWTKWHSVICRHPGPVCIQSVSAYLVARQASTQISKCLHSTIWNTTGRT